MCVVGREGCNHLDDEEVVVVGKGIGREANPHLGVEAGRDQPRLARVREQRHREVARRRRQHAHAARDGAEERWEERGEMREVR